MFLSQQEYFKPIGKTLYSQGSKQGGEYLAKASEWFKVSIYPRVSREAASRGEVVKIEINNQKNNAVQNIWESFKNYFAAQFSKFSGTKVK